MGIEFRIYSEKWLVLNTGSLITFLEETPAEYELKLDNTQTVKVIMKFENTQSGKRELNRTYVEEDNTIVFTCTNFTNVLGTGTVEAVKILTYQGKAIYINFWVFQLGNTGLKRIDYCFYQEQGEPDA